MRGVSEPYRMFTSRAEYRLRLRADNADQRLTPIGIELGTVSAARRSAFEFKAKALQDGRALLESLTLTPNEASRHGVEINRDGRRRSAFELLSFPDVDLKRLAAVWPAAGAIAPVIAAQLEVDASYAAYVDRQEADVVAFRKEESVRIPPDFDYGEVTSLSNEVRQRLEKVRPATLAQAGRMEGMTPAALMLLLAHLRKAPGRKSA
jgi:tRNA uridine 5-carboxymethylaminomethyl modification enzyme